MNQRESQTQNLGGKGTGVPSSQQESLEAREQYIQRSGGKESGHPYRTETSLLL